VAYPAKKSSGSNDPDRITGAGIGGAILGASLGGPPGAIIGALLGILAAGLVIEEERKDRETDDPKTGGQ
jgi:hypothetical protein